MDEKEALFEANFNLLKLRYRSGKVPKITNTEREILEFCHSRDMVEFVREEFRRNPILYNEHGDPIVSPAEFAQGQACPDSFYDGAPMNLSKEDEREIL